MDGNSVNEDPVVVIGLSFRFPQGAVSEDAFWKIICEGISTMTEVPESRYNINGHYFPDSSRQDVVSISSHLFVFHPTQFYLRCLAVVAII